MRQFHGSLGMLYSDYWDMYQPLYNLLEFRRHLWSSLPARPGNKEMVSHQPSCPPTALLTVLQ